MLVVSVLKIVGIKVVKIEFLIVVNGFIKLVFKFEIVCFLVMFFFFLMVKLIFVIIVLKKFEVLKNCVCVFIIFFNLGVLFL